MQSINVRDGMEIHRAHDILKCVLLGETPIELSDPVIKARLTSALDTLCWVLNHRHNRSFADNIANIEKALREQGYELVSVEKDGKSATGTVQ